MAFLAYCFRTTASPGSVQARLRGAEQHLRHLYRADLRRTEVGDGRSGFIAWRPSDSGVDWDFYRARDGVGTAWLHVPSLAGGPESGVDAWTLADAVLDGSLHPSDLGAPFALARWRSGTLDIVNDMLGLARIFHFTFEDGDVWCTRQGLAHIFMGEEPSRNQEAWAGMAAVGWALRGHTQLGHGRQLLGGSRVSAGHGTNGRYVDVRNDYGTWLTAVRSRPVPSAHENARDMEQLISSAKRWPAKAIADLSGGRDSRVCAALGIRSDAVSAVRTINTDRGEVETAKRLMESVDAEVEHLVIEPKHRATPVGNFLDRIATQHVAYEGRFLAATAVNAPAFTGFRSGPRAKFNGLGGEVLGGGNFATGSWRDKMIGAPAPAATERLVRMATVSRFASREARETAAAQMEGLVALAESIEAATAGEVLDMAYSRDRMPNWSVTFATSDVLCPLFSPSTLATSVHSMGAPAQDRDLHRELLETINPAWARVPFYKPTSQRTRSTPYLWNDSNWTDIERYVRERVDSSGAFDADGVLATLDVIVDGEPGKSEEVALFRFLWDQTFDDYVAQVATEARSVRASVRAHVESPTVAAQGTTAAPPARETDF